MKIELKETGGKNFALISRGQDALDAMRKDVLSFVSSVLGKKVFQDYLQALPVYILVVSAPPYEWALAQRGIMGRLYWDAVLTLDGLVIFSSEGFCRGKVILSEHTLHAYKATEFLADALMQIPALKADLDIYRKAAAYYYN